MPPDSRQRGRTVSAATVHPGNALFFTCRDSNVDAKKIVMCDRPGLDAPEEIVNTIFMSADEAEA